MKALIFDVDGTLAETEGVHRLAFNAAFEEEGIGWHWDLDFNRELLAISGGMERMKVFQARLPEAERFDEDRLRAIHGVKKRHYSRMLADGVLTLRPGVQKLLDAAQAAGLLRAVVTASGRASIEALVQGCLHASADEIFDVIVTGDDVSRKKPDPEGYLSSLQRLGIAAEEAIAFEDSPVGTAAALAAGLRVVVTPSEHGPVDGDYGDGLVVPSLEPTHWARFGFSPAG